MFANTSVQEFFPTPVWTVDLKPTFAEALNRQLLADIMRMTSPRPMELELGGFWQTETDMHVRPEFAKLTSLLQKACKAALEFLQVEHRGISITACWANIGPNGRAAQRSHPSQQLLQRRLLRADAGRCGVDRFLRSPACRGRHDGPYTPAQPLQRQPDVGQGTSWAHNDFSVLAVARRADEPDKSGARQHRLQRDVHRFHRGHEPAPAPGQSALPVARQLNTQTSAQAPREYRRLVPGSCLGLPGHSNRRDAGRTGEHRATGD